jgi:hypothetical protein
VFDGQNGSQHGDVPNTSSPDINRVTLRARAVYMHSQKGIKIRNLRISTIESERVQHGAPRGLQMKTL